jgi:hypothetical protein
MESWNRKCSFSSSSPNQQLAIINNGLLSKLKLLAFLNLLFVIKQLTFSTEIRKHLTLEVVEPEFR